MCIRDRKRTAAGKYAAMEMDTNARPAGEKEMPPDPEAILEQIREEAEESSFRFKINSEPNFTSPEAEGDLCIDVYKRQEPGRR